MPAVLVHHRGGQRADKYDQPGVVDPDQRQDHRTGRAVGRSRIRAREVPADRCAPQKKQQRRRAATGKCVPPADMAVRQVVEHHGKHRCVDRPGGQRRHQRQHPLHLPEDQLQEGVDRHRDQQQEAQPEHQPEREHALAQPRHQSRQPRGVRAEDLVERVLQLCEHRRRADEQQRRAPQAGERSRTGTHPSVGDDGARDALGLGPREEADLLQQRLLRAGQQLRGQPEDQQQHRRQRQHRIERQRRRLRQQFGIDEATQHGHRQCALCAADGGFHRRRIDGFSALRPWRTRLRGIELFHQHVLRAGQCRLDIPVCIAFVGHRCAPCNHPHA